MKRPHGLSGLCKIRIEFSSTFKCHLREEFKRAVELCFISTGTSFISELRYVPVDEPKLLACKKQWSQQLKSVPQLPFEKLDQRQLTP